MQPTVPHLMTFRRLFLAHAPTYQAWMQPSGADAKYRKKFHPISDAELAAHLAGRLTIAAPLSGSDDLGYAAALDLDSGGDDALHALLDITCQHGWTAMAFTSAHATHHGGHVWLLFDAPAAPTTLRRLANDLAHEGGVAAETYPSGRMLRLPLGVHRGSGQRGRLLLQDGTALDLDAGGDTIATALTLLDTLPRNAVAQLPPAPIQPSEGAAQTRQNGPGATERAGSTIEAYNATTDLLSLLIGYGGRIAEHYRSGRAVLHCPCGQHRTGDAHASLEIQPARNRRYGQCVAVGYAPACAFSLEQRRVFDAFAVYCHFEHLTPVEAIRVLRRTVGTVAAPTRSVFPAPAAGVQLPLDGDGGPS